jgi:hypothetical protein
MKKSHLQRIPVTTLKIPFKALVSTGPIGFFTERRRNSDLWSVFLLKKRPHLQRIPVITLKIPFKALISTGPIGFFTYSGSI